MNATFQGPIVLLATHANLRVNTPLFTALCGWGLFLRSPAALLFALAMALFLHLLVVCVEEPKLERRYGDSFREHKRRVGRWIPSRRKLAA